MTDAHRLQPDAPGRKSGFQGVSLVRRLEHALQRRLCNFGEGRTDLGLLGCRHPFGLDGRYAGFANAPQQRFPQVAVLDGSGGMIMQAAADGFGMRPAVHHVRRTLTHELGARIGQFLQRAELNLFDLCLPNLPYFAPLDVCLRRTTENDRCGYNCTDTKMHEGLPASFLEHTAAASQRAATTIPNGTSVTTGEPV